MVWYFLSDLLHIYIYIKVHFHVYLQGYIVCNLIYLITFLEISNWFWITVCHTFQLHWKRFEWPKSLLLRFSPPGKKSPLAPAKFPIPLTPLTTIWKTLLLWGFITITTSNMFYIYIYIYNFNALLNECLQSYIVCNLFFLIFFTFLLCISYS